jgi:hypothetical protein
MLSRAENVTHNPIAPPDRSRASPKPASDARVEIAVAGSDPSDADYAYHVETYRSFVRYSLIFTAHVAVVLALLAYFFV